MITLRAPESVGPRRDLRLAMPAGAAWACAWAVLLAGPDRGRAVLAGAACGALLVLAAVRRRPGVRWSVVAVACAVLAVGVAALLRVTSVRPPVVVVAASHGLVATVDLAVTSDPAPLTGRWSSDRVRVAARLERIDSPRVAAHVRVPVTVFAPASWRGLLPGTRVRTRARFGPTTYRDEAALLVARSPPTVVAGPGRVQRAAGALRAGLRAAVAQQPSDARGLVPGMVLGDTSGVSAPLRDDERAAGLTHLTAVSGANVAVLLAAVLGAARLVGVRRRGLVAVGLLAVVGFVVVARPEPSVLRAAVMGSILLIGVLRGGARRGLPVLAAGVLLLLLVDPWLACSWGFALSVAATAGLLELAPRWRDAWSRVLPRRVAEPLAVASVAHLATAPLIASFSGRVSLVAVGANLAAEPAVAVVTVSGAVAAVVSPLSTDAARWCAEPAGWGARWVATVAHRSAALPLADVGWPAGPLALAALAGACGAALLLVPRALEGTARGADPGVGAAWHASRDVTPARTAAPGDPRRRSRGPARRARGRHRRRAGPRARRRRRRA